MRLITLSFLIWLTPLSLYAETPHHKETQTIEQLNEPLYNPFIERYVIDELKELRTEMLNLEVRLTKEITNREVTMTSRAVGYVTDAVSYFFYLIAAISSVLVLLGWTSIKEIKEKTHEMADARINKVVSEYEERLAHIEKELNKKSHNISQAQQQISTHKDIHNLWLKAGQEQIANNRIAIYDQILELEPNNAEALTYKADTALELNEPQWAISLCTQALKIDPENRHTFYQLAGAYTLMNRFEEALQHLEKSLEGSESMIEETLKDPIFENLRDNEHFKTLLQRTQS